MGTTLTGTTPANTYDSLIKVTDNGPLSGTAKYLSDGLGNDSKLALSTGETMGFGTDTPQTDIDGFSTSARGLTIKNFYPCLALADSDGGRFFLANNSNNAYVYNGGSGNLILATNNAEKMRITSAGYVGIGTSSPSATLNIKSISSNNSNSLADVLTNSEFRLQYRADDISSLYIGGLGSERGYLQGVNSTASSGADISLNPYGGNVGIGTASPATNLDVKGNNAKIRITPSAQNNVQALEIGVNNSGVTQYAKIDVTNLVNYDTNIRFFTNSASSTTQVERLRILANGGITFNGDTAAANALDDYEEGTFTATLKGSTSDPTTPVTSTGYYTKIGNRVMVDVYFSGADTTGAAGEVSVSGLPFTSGSGTRFGGPVSTYQFNFSGTSLSAFMGQGSTVVSFLSSVNGGSWTGMTHSAGAGRYLAFSVTYFV